jgi:hypothetical protein
VCVCPGITLERLERFQQNLVHILLYVCMCKNLMYVIYIYIYIYLLSIDFPREFG